MSSGESKSAVAEAAHGGADGLRQLFDTHSWAQISAALASSGIGCPSSSALEPSSFTMVITRASNGAKITLKFSNVDGGGTNGTAERVRGTDFLTANGCN